MKARFPASRGGRPSGLLTDGRVFSIVPASPANSIADALRRTLHYRRDLDTWHAGSPSVPMPQPHEFDLRLGLMSSAVVLWPGAK